MSRDEHLAPTSHLSIQELPGLVRAMLTRSQQPPLAETARPWGLFVRYLRRKPARGLAVIYDACEILPHRQRASAARRTVSLTLDESALAGSTILVTPEQLEHVTLEVQPTGIIQAEELGLALQAFPADSNLPHLVASCETSLSSALFPSLQEAARLLLADEGWQLLNAQAVPVRYKPANRCVIRYELTMQRSNGQQRALSLFGKLYANPDQARTVQALLQRLYAEQLEQQGSTLAGFTQHTPLLPRPLLLIEQYGLTLNEAIQPSTPQGRLHTGTSVLQPRVIRQRGGRLVSQEIPEAELRLAAIALARLHTSKVEPGQATLRTGAREAKRVRERAGLLAGYYHTLAPDIQGIAFSLVQSLEELQPESYRPAHGGFKASQLLYRDGAISVVDFDGFCLADPALDVGYFLAYLRPGGLWYKRQGMRSWFEAAAEIFTNTYAGSIDELGVTCLEIAGILQRSHLYAAALLFKIATRRVNRLNSPRPYELANMLTEARVCLAMSTRRD